MRSTSIAIAFLASHLAMSPIAYGSYADVLLGGEAIDKKFPNMAAKIDRFHKRGRDSEAIELAYELLTQTEASFGPDNVAVLTPLSILSELYDPSTDYAKLIPLYERVLAICEKHSSADPGVTADTMYMLSIVATSLDNLAELYTTIGNYAKARPLLVRAVSIRETALGPDHPDVATSLNDLAELYITSGDYERAKQLHERALSIYERALGPDHPYVATSLNNLASLYDSTGDYEKAKPLHERALRIVVLVGRNDIDNSFSELHKKIDAFHKQGRDSEAIVLAYELLAKTEAAHGPNDMAVLPPLVILAGLYDPSTDYEKLIPLLERTLVISENYYGQDAETTAMLMSVLASQHTLRASLLLKDHEKAVSLYEKAIQVLEQERVLGPDLSRPAYPDPV